MANRFGRMPVSPEMNTFKAEVRGDQHFVLGPRPQHRTVVSDTGEEGTIPPLAPGWTAIRRMWAMRVFSGRGTAKEIIAQTDPPRACVTNLAMHQFRPANDRNQPLDQVRYHPLRNPWRSSSLVDRGNPVCYLLPVIRSTLAELSSVFGKNADA